jgi:hypothetical protein
MAEQQQQQSQGQQVQTVKVVVRQQGGQEQQRVFMTPVPSSFVEHKLEQQYGPGKLCLEVGNAVLAPTEELQSSERYIYDVFAGVCGPSRALGRRVSVLQQTPQQPTVHSGSPVLQRSATPAVGPL